MRWHSTFIQTGPSLMQQAKRPSKGRERTGWLNEMLGKATCHRAICSHCAKEGQEKELVRLCLPAVSACRRLRQGDHWCSP